MTKSGRKPGKVMLMAVTTGIAENAGAVGYIISGFVNNAVGDIPRADTKVSVGDSQRQASENFRGGRREYRSESRPASAAPLIRAYG